MTAFRGIKGKGRPLEKQPAIANPLATLQFLATVDILPAAVA
jgi:hypothetical protein